MTALDTTPLTYELHNATRNRPPAAPLIQRGAGCTNSVTARRSGATGMAGFLRASGVGASNAATVVHVGTQPSAQRRGSPARSDAHRAGQARYIVGREDMNIDIALQLRAEAS